MNSVLLGWNPGDGYELYLLIGRQVDRCRNKYMKI